MRPPTVFGRCTIQWLLAAGLASPGASRSLLELWDSHSCRYPEEEAASNILMSDPPDACMPSEGQDTREVSRNGAGRADIRQI